MMLLMGNQSFDQQNADSALFGETSSFLFNISSFVASSTVNPSWVYSSSSYGEPVTSSLLQTSIVSSNKSSDSAAPTSHHPVNIWEAGKIRIPLYRFVSASTVFDKKLSPIKTNSEAVHNKETFNVNKENREGNELELAVITMSAD